MIGWYCCIRPVDAAPGDNVNPELGVTGANVISGTVGISDAALESCGFEGIIDYF